MEKLSIIGVYGPVHDSGTSIGSSMTQEVQSAVGSQTESNTGMRNVGHLGHPNNMTEITNGSLCSLS